MMTTPLLKKNPKGWTSKDDALLDKAIRKALPPSKVFDDLGRTEDTIPSAPRDNKQESHPLNRSSRARQKKV